MVFDWRGRGGDYRLCRGHTAVPTWLDDVMPLIETTDDLSRVGRIKDAFEVQAISERTKSSRRLLNG